VNAVDSGVVAAAFASWQEPHDEARLVFDAGAGDPGAVLVSCDRRAMAAYGRVGTAATLID